VIDRYWAADTAPVFEIIAEYGPFDPKTSGVSSGPAPDPG